MDGVCVYDCPRMGQAYLQMMRNGLSIPSNENNLIVPFIMREAGLDVNSKPKIHCKSNHAGSDKWDAMIEAAESYVITKKWDGS